MRFAAFGSCASQKITEFGVASFYLHRALKRSGVAVPAVVLPASLLGVVLFSDSLAIWVWTTVLVSHLVFHSGRDATLGRAICVLLNSRPIQMLGRVSYSIYLLHMTVVYFGIYIRLKFRADWTSGTFCFALAGIVLVGVIAGAHLLYTWVEKPGMDFARRSGARFSQSIAVRPRSDRATIPS